MKKLLIAIVALLAGIAGIVATTPAQAANGVGAVIFSTDQDHGNIYEWDAATNAVTLVTNGSWPRLSPDGTRIAFHRVPSYKAFSGNNIASFDDVLVRNLATGSETRAVAVGDWTDAYNWVGNDHLVYDWGCGVLENGADGGPAVTLGGFDGGCYDDAPAYNAATGTLYFAESPGSPYLDPGIYSGTPYYAATQLFKLQTPVFQWPSLSPDGSRLLFACGPTSLCAGSSPSFPQIGTIGSGPETIQGYPSSIAAAWTPDGSAAVGAGPDNSLRLFPADGSNTTGTVLATIDPALYGTIDWVGGVVAPAAVDATPPAISCGSADGEWHKDNVTIACTARDEDSGLADPADASFSLATHVAAGASDANAATDSHQVCDKTGNCSIAGPIGGNKIDRVPPTLHLPGDQTANATGPAGASVFFTVTASDDIGTPTIGCWAITQGNSVPVSPGDTFPVGTTTIACTATDEALNTSTGGFTITVTATDTTAPVISCGSPDGAWHKDDVTIGCTAHDVDSGLADPADASFSLSTHIATGSSSANAATDSHQVCDKAGNCATAGPIGGNRIDRVPPVLHLPGNQTVNATGPAGASVFFTVTASDDIGIPTIGCPGFSPGDTFPIGVTTVTCTATDEAGNTATDSFTITVRGAKDQLNNLIQKVVNSTALPTTAKTQLIAGLQALVASFNPANAAQKQLVCGALKVFVAAVQAMSGKTIPATVAADWIADANRIRAVLGCP